MTIRAIARRDLGTLLYEERLENCLLVDTYNGAPLNMRRFRYINPFYTWLKPCIPVPGWSGQQSRSVEAIWQGTKLVAGVTDEKQFLTHPYKRPTDDARRVDANYRYQDATFMYHDKVISLLEARFLIYLIAYLYLLKNIVPKKLLNYIDVHIQAKKQIIFFDWDQNFDISNITESFSHSSILVSWFSNTVEEDYLHAAKLHLPSTWYDVFVNEFNQVLNR